MKNQLSAAAAKIISSKPLQVFKRRQSGKSPVGDIADLVVVQVPASANNRVSKAAQSRAPPRLFEPTPTHRRHLSVPNTLSPAN
jgi:dihydroorotase-like cyclic amidohydrolase